MALPVLKRRTATTDAGPNAHIVQLLTDQLAKLNPSESEYMGLILRKVRTIKFITHAAAQKARFFNPCRLWHCPNRLHCPQLHCLRPSKQSRSTLLELTMEKRRRS
jgi:hypothetical protein